MVKPLTTEQFRERLLGIMDRKHHWAWPHFSRGAISKDQHKIHFQQEYAVYVRDFPVFLSRIHGQNPPPEVRSLLAANIYEEETGGLSLGRAHPELFLTMMKGFGFEPAQFRDVALLPASRTYRKWLDTVSSARDWIVGAAVLTIFVEGSVNDRREIQEPSKPKTKAEIEEFVKEHPLVRNHGLSPEYLDLVRAHQMVEAGHRQDAYAIILAYATTRKQQEAVLAGLSRSRDLWLRFRDGVARACGLKRS